jgi:hypothetical protein
MSEHAIYLCDPAGNRLAMLDKARNFSYAKIANAPGWFNIVLPPDYDDLLRVDGIVEIWRAPTDARSTLAFAGLLRHITYTTDVNGVDGTTISGSDFNELISRRIVAYAAGTAYADKTDQADDMLKALAYENLGAGATDTTRTQSGFTDAADLAAGVSVTKAFAWRNMLRVFNDITAASATGGTDVYWWVDYDPETQATLLQTKTGYPGQDRTEGSTNSPAIFGVEWGNLSAPSLELDYTEEITHAYAGGQGEGSDRVTGTASDTTRSGRSIFGRREAFADARMCTTAAGVTDAADSLLHEGRARLRFRGALLDSPQARYGVDWNFGDQVTITYRGYQFSAIVKTVEISINAMGREFVSAGVEVVGDL